MDVLPIVSKNSTHLRRYCTVECQDGSVSAVTVHGMIDLPWEELCYCTSALTGGDFQEYILDAMKSCNGKICLHLEPLQHKFTLPCYDGNGIHMAENAVQHFRNKQEEQFSPDLLCNYLYLPHEPAVILFDTAETLQKKVNIAHAACVPLLIADEWILEKIKTP